MLFAPNSCRHGSTLITNGDNVVLVSTRAFDRCDVETEDMPSLVRTFDVHWSATLLTRHASAIVRLANLADLLKTSPRNGRNSFARLQSLCISKFDLWCEDSAGNVDPIVVCRPLQGLSRVDGPAIVLLTLPVEIGCFNSHLLLQSLTFAFLLGLLLVGYLWRFHKVMISELNRAKDTFVVLERSVSKHA